MKETGTPPAETATLIETCAQPMPEDSEDMSWRAETVPLLHNGSINWTALEKEFGKDDSDSEHESDVRVETLDFNQPQSSKLHPYFHHEDPDCCIIGHKCACPACTAETRVASSPEPASPEPAATAIGGGTITRIYV